MVKYACKPILSNDKWGNICCGAFQKGFSLLQKTHRDKLVSPIPLEMPILAMVPRTAAAIFLPT